ncbi:MAG: hypothetical protein MZV49_01905 [Rhodopseudomonas palustris]|nr:hypothetical protein [Rhodopseudomonas palustris]
MRASQTIPRANGTSLTSWWRRSIFDEGRIDPDQWKKHREACRVARQRPNRAGKPAKAIWCTAPADRGRSNTIASGEARGDEAGYHFQDERFVLDEYVSTMDGGKMRTFRVVGVSHL